jgi:hypothetical protein
LLIPTKATALRRNQRPRASFPLAGFEVTLIGRFWVTPEAMRSTKKPNAAVGQCPSIGLLFRENTVHPKQPNK